MVNSGSARPLWQGRALAVVGVILFSFSLRVAVASLSPVFDHIAVDFPLPAAVIGLIGTAPPVCYAIFGILTPLWERRFGLERVAVVAAAVAAVGLSMRAFVGNSLSLLLATAVIFAAVGVGNILLPPLAKKYFPDRIGLITTIYMTTMALATFTPPLIAVPVADAVGWRTSLGLWGIFGVLAVIPWVAMVARERVAASVTVETANPRVFGRLWRSPLAWALTVGFTVSGTLAYTSFAWLPTILVDIAGVTPAAAGALLSLFAAMGLPASLLVPGIAARLGRIRLLFGIAAACGLVAIAGLLWIPSVLTWLWVALLGAAPLLFPLTLVMLGLRTRTPQAAVALSGFVQSVGYAIVAVFPFGIGLIHDATDSWTVPLIALGVVVASAIPAGVIAARPQTIEDEWERRHGAW